ncbi:hypothetical protein N0V88_008213 [Collariella sp. IMI 366227]|nr:hypothetical protein N0V88_008213 [Collariella sp. IMI 366227]
MSDIGTVPRGEPLSTRDRANPAGRDHGLAFAARDTQPTAYSTSTFHPTTGTARPPQLPNPRPLALSRTDSQTTSSTNGADHIFTPPASGGRLSPGTGSAHGSSQESQLLQLSQIAAAQERIPETTIEMGLASASRKRMADGIVKHPREKSNVSPGQMMSHSRNTSTVSVASTSGSRIGELSVELKARLSYAMVKVNHAMLVSPHTNVREQTAIESLLFMSSPGNSANLKHAFPGSSSQPLPSAHQPQQQRTALPTSQPRKSLLRPPTASRPLTTKDQHLKTMPPNKYLRRVLRALRRRKQAAKKAAKKLLTKTGRKYIESLPSFLEHVTLVFTTSLDAHHFFVQRPHPFLAHLRHLEFCFCHSYDHLFLTKTLHSEVGPDGGRRDGEEDGDGAAVEGIMVNYVNHVAGARESVCTQARCDVDLFGGAFWLDLMKGLWAVAPGLRDLDVTIGGSIRHWKIMRVFGECEGGYVDGGEGEELVRVADEDVWELPGKVLVRFPLGGQEYVQQGRKVVKLGERH